MKAFECILSPISNRIVKKPRKNGITMIVDTGLGLSNVEDVCQVSGEYLDIVKIGFGTSRLYEEEVLKKKIKIYKKHGIDVSTGGTLFEISFSQDSLDIFFDEAKNLGFSMVEISDGIVNMDLDDKIEAIHKAKEYGFKVVSEVGKKKVEDDLSTEEYIEELKNVLREGDVFKAIIESRSSGKGLGIYDERGKIRTDRFFSIVTSFDTNRILFEAPLKNQQTFLILNLGSNVNLGNIKPNEVISCEALRRGLRGDTLQV